jgi:hypothetical protein
MAKSKSKRFVFVSEEILERLMDAQSRRGKDLSVFIEEILREALRVEDMGQDFRQVVNFLEALQVLMISGAVFTPLDIFNHLSEKVYKSEGDELRKNWYESGLWYGKYMKDKFNDPVDFLMKFLKAMRWDLDEVEVKRNGDAVKIRCVSTVMTPEGTGMLLSFIEGVMQALGYETRKNDHVKGIILLEFCAN